MALLEQGLFRIYEKLLRSASGPPGASGSDDVRVRASALRRRRKLKSVATGVMTGLAVLSTLTLIFIITGHSLFIGESSGRCFADSVAKAVARMPENPSMQLYSNSSENRDPGKTALILPLDVVLRVSISNGDEPQTDQGSNQQAKLSTIEIGSGSSAFIAGYEFARKAAYISLNPSERKQHNVGILNVTLGPKCLGPVWVANFFGMDTVVINQLLWGLNTGGVLHNLESDEYWSWSPGLLESYGPSRHGFLNTLIRLSTGATLTVLAFFLISGVTAAIVRILLVSGVILVFPIVLAALRFSDGAEQVGTTIISHAYPWIGYAMDELRSTGRPVWSFVFAHTARVIVYWTIYSACQAAWSSWFYGKSIPMGLHTALFGIFMILEYFSMIFVRAKLTIRHFPRIIAGYFCLYQAYFYSTLYGFYWQSLQLFLLLCSHAMCWFCFKVEVTSFQSGEISEERPRAYVVRLGEPRWAGSAPTTASLFHPVTENLVDVPRSYEETQEQLNFSDQRLSHRRRQLDHAESEGAQNGFSALLQMAGVSFNPSTYYTESSSQDGLRRRRDITTGGSIGGENADEVSGGESKRTLPNSNFHLQEDTRLDILSDTDSNSTSEEDDDEKEDASFLLTRSSL